MQHRLWPGRECMWRGRRLQRVLDYRPTKPDNIVKQIKSLVLSLHVLERPLPPAGRCRGSDGGVEDVEGDTRGDQETDECPVTEERRRGGEASPSVASSTVTPTSTPVLGPVTEGSHHVGLPVIPTGAVEVDIVSITTGLTTTEKIHSPGPQS